MHLPVETTPRFASFASQALSKVAWRERRGQTDQASESSRWQYSSPLRTTREEGWFPTLRVLFGGVAAKIVGSFQPSSNDRMSTSFSKLGSLPAREILDGSIRGRYAHLRTMTIGEVWLDANTVVPMHSHPHEQTTYVMEGRFEFTVAGETAILEPGMVALIPSGALHGGRTITTCRVIDVFSPARDDYR